MGTISEYAGERYLYTEAEALEPGDVISNNDQLQELEAQVSALLQARGIIPVARNFKRSYYCHSGAVILTLKYVLENHRGHVVPNIES